MGPTAVGSPAASQACALLRPEEVQGVLGAPAQGVPTDASCSWRSTSVPATLTLAVVGTDPDTCVAARPEGAARVTGLGVDAWWEVVQAEVTVGNLVACAAGSQVTVSLSGMDDQALMRAKAQDLIRTVLGRL